MTVMGVNGAAGGRRPGVRDPGLTPNHQSGRVRFRPERRGVALWSVDRYWLASALKASIEDYHSHRAGLNT